MARSRASAGLASVFVGLMVGSGVALLWPATFGRAHRIALELRCDGDLAAAARDPALAEMIKGETLSGSLGVAPFEESAAAGDAIGFAGNEVFEIDGESLFVSLHRRGD